MHYFVLVLLFFIFIHIFLLFYAWLGKRYFRLSAIGALIYLANCIRPNILFSVNLLARYSSAPTRRHLNSIKHILHYLRGTTDMSLFYSRESKQQLLGYADAEYLSYSYKSKSQTWYVFNYNGTTISWRSIKQIMVVTSSNHSEILAIHEASCECIWLRSMIQHIQETCGLPSIRGNATKLHEDNVACIGKIKGGFIKGDKTKHISLNSSILMSSERKVRSMFSRFDHAII